MRQNWDELEKQVEAGMAALAGELDVPLPRDVLGRARRVGDDLQLIIAVGPIGEREARAGSAVGVGIEATKLDLLATWLFEINLDRDVRHRLAAIGQAHAEGGCRLRCASPTSRL